MTRRVHLVLSVVVGVALLAAAALAAQAPARTRMTLSGLVIEANAWSGDISGPWKWSKGVTVTAQDMVVTCDTLEAQPAKGGRSFSRLEATGNVHIRGTYTASDGTPWKVVGSSEAASYDAAKAQGVLRGNVEFQATNQTTKAVVHVTAAKAIYNTKTQKFEFPETGQPVHVEWQQPEQPAAAAPSAGGR